MSRTPPMPSGSRVSSWIATSIGLGLVLALTLSTFAAGVKEEKAEAMLDRVLEEAYQALLNPDPASYALS